MRSIAPAPKSYACWRMVPDRRCDRKGEKTWEAALREVREETNLNCDQLYSADICEQFYDADRDAISMLTVFVGFVDADAAG